MKLRYMMGAVAAALVLAGCGEDEIELVKNYTLPDFKSISIGTAIEGSKKCKNITWSHGPILLEKIIFILTRNCTLYMKCIIL